MQLEEMTVEQALRAMNLWAQQMRVGRADFRIEKLLRATYELLNREPTLPGMEATFANATLLVNLPGMRMERGL